MNCDIKRRGKMNVELMVIFKFTVKVVKSCVFAKSLKWISEKDEIAGKAHVYLNLTPGMAPNYKMISNNL
jgi:hypothetical protein